MANQVVNQTENIDIFDPKNITAGTVRQYLDNGNKASDSELAMLVTMAKHQNLNPFLKEIYFIKYGTAPAQFVVSRDAYRKRAQKDPNFNGIKTGVIVENEDGSIEKFGRCF
jgi:phage recombination protein Bet